MENILYRVPSIWTHRRYNPDGTLAVNLDAPSSTRFLIRSQTGSTGPKPPRPLPINNYDFNVQDIVLNHVARYDYGGSGFEEANGGGLSVDIAGATLLPDYDWSNLEAKALDKLTESVRGGLDLSVDLAEAGKTVKMLKLTDQVVNVAKTAMGRRLGAVKAVGSLLLMNTYGVQPLLQSIYGLAEENLNIVINKTRHFQARASEMYRPTHVGLNSVVGGVNFPVLQSRGLKASVTIGCDLSTHEFEMARFSSLNPLSIAWELQPLSFVGDWFFNLGGYLRQMETALLYAKDFNSGYRTKLMVGSLSVLLSQQGGGSEPYSSVWQGSLRMVGINRRILTGYPAPRFPSFKASLGSSRMLSAAALLSQVLAHGKSTPVQRLSRTRQKAVQERSRSYASKPGDKLGVLPPSDWGV